MKPDQFLSSARARHAAMGVALLVGTTALLAQAGGAGSSNDGTDPTGAPGAKSTTGTRLSQEVRRDADTPSDRHRTRQNGSRTQDHSSVRPATQTQAAGINPAHEAMGAERLAWSDRRFVQKAADSGMTELSLAQLAARKATDPDVRDFAQQSVEDHQKANTDLMALANRHNVNLEFPNLTEERVYRRLTHAAANEFDREFIAEMIEMHESDVRRFERAAKEAESEDVRAFAREHVGTLREHLQRAEELQESLQPTGRESPASGSSTGSSRREHERTP